MQNNPGKIPQSKSQEKKIRPKKILKFENHNKSGANSTEKIPELKIHPKKFLKPKNSKKFGGKSTYGNILDPEIHRKNSRAENLIMLMSHVPSSMSQCTRRKNVAEILLDANFFSTRNYLWNTFSEHLKKKKPLTSTSFLVGFLLKM